MNYELYVVDTETTGIELLNHSPIEISIYRISNGEQKTWFLKPINMDKISPDALRVNGHKIEDLKGLTKYGRELYQDPSHTLIDVENWLAQDNLSSSDRLLVGQNIAFDKNMLIELWRKCNSEGTFPFNEKYSLDTMIIEFAINLAKDKTVDGYSLKNLCKSYGVRNEKAHSSEADTKATAEVFRHQIESLKKAFSR